MNRSLANKLSLGFIGCASHRFHLALKEIIKNESNEALLDKVRYVVKYLKRPVIAGKLQKFTHLRAVTDCSTRWRSTAQMLRQFIEQKPILLEIDEEFDQESLCFPRTREWRRIKTILANYAERDTVTKSLQNDTTTCSDVRLLFDAVIAKYPKTELKLGANATIAHQLFFEMAITKIQNYEERCLTANKSLQ